MGLAKYFEDNVEIIEERKQLRDDSFYSCVGQHLNDYVPYINYQPKIEKITPPKKRKKLTISCVTCNKTFKFNGGEQKFYEEHKLSYPTHCPECRAKRKQKIKNKEI